MYAAFIIDAYSKFIVGWQTATTLRASLAIDALEMALATRRRRNPQELIHHSDRGSQYLSRYTTRLAESQIVASVGSKGDSYDNALAETTIGLYKTELIHQRGPLARPGPHHLRHPRIHRLVQPPTPTRRNHPRQHLHHPRRPRNQLPKGRHQTTPRKPVTTQTTHSL